MRKKVPSAPLRKHTGWKSFIRFNSHLFV